MHVHFFTTRLSKHYNSRKYIKQKHLGTYSDHAITFEKKYTQNTAHGAHMCVFVDISKTKLIVIFICRLTRDTIFVRRRARERTRQTKRRRRRRTVRRSIFRLALPANTRERTVGLLSLCIMLPVNRSRKNKKMRPGRPNGYECTVDNTYTHTHVYIYLYVYVAYAGIEKT